MLSRSITERIAVGVQQDYQLRQLLFRECDPTVVTAMRAGASCGKPQNACRDSTKCDIAKSLRTAMPMHERYVAQPFQMRSTGWMTCDASKRYPPESLASPDGHLPSFRHSAISSGLGARWMALSTPPPPRGEAFAALTIASTFRRVMSPIVRRRHKKPMPEPSKIMATCPRRLIRPPGGRADRKKDRSRQAGSGQVAGGKPATGRLCQAGLRK
jgi:hypothetical protein